MEALNLEMHFARDLTTTGTVDGLGGWLSTNASKVAATLEVHAYERDPDRIALDLHAGGNLLAAVADRGLSRGQVHERLVNTYGPAPEESRRFGSAMVRGRGRGVSGTHLTM
ncbi:MAG TPA: hypothetical protein VD814_07585, partial [Nocardioides sp.]|nr:hypothetical protein [Nocardioides sp.]